jgi:DNA-binding transcriptional ArsR family regulator
MKDVSPLPRQPFCPKLSRSPIGRRAHLWCDMPDTQTESPNMQISRTQLWQAVRLPLRLRILETARRLGETSVTELAQAVGLNRTALYFHLRHLEKAGLLVSRAGAPTPGRRGKRPRYYRCTVADMTIEMDGDSKRDQQRLADFYRPWLTESRATALERRAGGVASRRISLHWENFTDEEVSRLRALCGEIDELARRARSRANTSRKAPAATHHIGVIFAAVDGQVMPGPEIKVKEAKSKK